MGAPFVTHRLPVSLSLLVRRSSRLLIFIYLFIYPPPSLLTPCIALLAAHSSCILSIFVGVLEALALVRT